MRKQCGTNVWQDMLLKRLDHAHVYLKASCCCCALQGVHQNISNRTVSIARPSFAVHCAMDADIGWLAWYIEANLRVRITGLDFVYCPAEEVVVGARCGAERGGSVGSGVRRRGSLT